MGDMTQRERNRDFRRNRGAAAEQERPQAGGRFLAGTGREAIGPSGSGDQGAGPAGESVRRVARPAPPAFARGASPATAVYRQVDAQYRSGAGARQAGGAQAAPRSGDSAFPADRALARSVAVGARRGPGRTAARNIRKPIGPPWPNCWKRPKKSAWSSVRRSAHGNFSRFCASCSDSFGKLCLMKALGRSHYGVVFRLGNDAGCGRHPRPARYCARGSRGLGASHPGSLVRVRRRGARRGASKPSLPVRAARPICPA